MGRDLEDENIVINYETLFELLRLERSRTELQQLPPSYVDDVRKMIASDMVGLSSISDENEKKKKAINIENTRKIINEVYERREKKILNLALNKSKTKSAIIDFSRFLGNEKRLFTEALNILDSYRDKDSFNISSDDVKGILEDKNCNPEPADPLQKDMPEETLPNEEGIGKGNLRAVRFISHFPSFMGPELEQYGPFLEEEIAALPSKIAKILVEKKRVTEIMVD